MVAAYHATLGELVRQLEDEIGAFYYDRTDLRLKHPVAKDEMIKSLVNNAPASIGGETIQQISTLDGVKYIMADDSLVINSPVRNGAGLASVRRRSIAADGQRIARLLKMRLPKR